MRRRNFLGVLGGAAVALPLGVRAQTSKTFRIGYLDPAAKSDPVASNLRRQFLIGMRDLGHAEGRDFQMVDRTADGDLSQLPALATDLSQLQVDVIVCASGEAAVRSAQRATSKIPIIMTVIGDPISGGFVKSLARPGGNITGLSALASEMAGKRVELLTELVPERKRVAVLWNPGNASKTTEWNHTRHAASAKGLTLVSAEIRTSGEMDGAFNLIGQQNAEALIVLVETLTIAHKARIAEFAMANRLPMIAELREFTVLGGLASYGISRPALWRRAAAYVHKIMQGAKPGDLPVEQPTTFEMVLNLKSAKSLDLEIPLRLQQLADEVIE